MTEQATIERAALAYVNFMRAEKGFPLVTALDGFRPEDRAGYIAHVTAVLAALRPGDVLPGGMVVEQAGALRAAQVEVEAAKKFGGGFYGEAVKTQTRDAYRKMVSAALPAQPKEGK